MVRVAAAALAFWTTGVPGMALLARLAMETLLPRRLKTPDLEEPNETELAPAKLSAPAWANWSEPWLIVIPPVKVLLPLRISVPPPFLASPIVPAPPPTAPPIVVL